MKHIVIHVLNHSQSANTNKYSRTID